MLPIIIHSAIDSGLYNNFLAAITQKFVLWHNFKMNKDNEFIFASAPIFLGSGNITKVI